MREVLRRLVQLVVVVLCVTFFSFVLLSLVPGDPVLGITDADVALTGEYMGRRRMTLTYPILDRSRRILWVVTGAEKTPMLNRLLAGDESIPAGRVCRENAMVLADRDAAAQLPAQYQGRK